jgi:hypothetical protein
MMPVPQRYRTDYDGEFVITSTIYRQGKKEQIREWVDNPISNEHESNRAVCIVDGVSTQGFLLHTLEHHKGGLLASKRMQSYGVQEMYKRMNCDFLIAKGQDMLDEVIESNYWKDNIVYTTATHCIVNPDMFYLVPHSIKMMPQVTAIWLACFDGHEEIFLFGYDEYTEDGSSQEKMIYGANSVMKAYPDVKFYHVIKIGSTPILWKHLPNLQTMNISEFVSYTDT